MNQDSNRNQENELMNDQDFDHFFKQALEHHQVQPAPEHWAKTKKWFMFRRLINIPKAHAFQIAASLLFILTATAIYFQLPAIEKSSLQAPVVTTQSFPIEKDTLVASLPIEESSSDFVLDITPDEDLEDEEVRAELIEKELDDFLAFLLDDEDEFASSIDSAEISKYLEPVEQLPIDEMFAVIPILPKKEVITILAPEATQITLPHRFVKDESEIEAYLLMYDNKKQ